MYAFFRNMNAARRTAIASNSAYFNIQSQPHQLNNHTIALSKPPFLGVLNNYGSSLPAIGVHVSPVQTSYKSLLPIIDVISGQILSTDPRGGLTVPIINGEPRVFLPLSVYRDPSGTAKESWGAPP